LITLIRNFFYQSSNSFQYPTFNILKINLIVRPRDTNERKEQTFKTFNFLCFVSCRPDSPPSKILKYWKQSIQMVKSHWQLEVQCNRLKCNVSCMLFKFQELNHIVSKEAVPTVDVLLEDVIGECTGWQHHYIGINQHMLWRCFMFLVFLQFLYRGYYVAASRYEIY